MEEESERLKRNWKEDQERESVYYVCVCVSGKEREERGEGGGARFKGK